MKIWEASDYQTKVGVKNIQFKEGEKMENGNINRVREHRELNFLEIL